MSATPSRCSTCGANAEPNAFCCEYCGAVLRTPISSDDELGALKELEAAARAAASKPDRHADTMRVFWQSAFVPHTPIGLRAAAVSALAAIPDVSSDEDSKFKENLPEIQALIARTRTMAETLFRHSNGASADREEALRILESLHSRTEDIRRAAEQWPSMLLVLAWLYGPIAFFVADGSLLDKLTKAGALVYLLCAPAWWIRRRKPFVAPGTTPPPLLKVSEIAALVLIPVLLVGLGYGPQYVANSKAKAAEAARLAAEHEAKGVWKDFNLVGSWRYEDSPKDPAIASNFEMHDQPMRKFISDESRLVFKANGSMMDADAGGSTYYCLRFVYPGYRVKEASYTLGDFAGNQAVLAVNAKLDNGFELTPKVTLLYEGKDAFTLIVPAEAKLQFPAKGRCRFVRAQ